MKVRHHHRQRKREKPLGGSTHRINLAPPVRLRNLLTMPITPSSLDHLIDVLGLEDTKELVQIYLDQTVRELDRLGALPVGKQMIVVHGLKGSSYQVGALLFAAQCGALESQLKDSDAVLSTDELAVLRAGFDECAHQFKIWLVRLVTD